MRIDAIQEDQIAASELWKDRITYRAAVEIVVAGLQIAAQRIEDVTMGRAPGRGIRRFQLRAGGRDKDRTAFHGRHRGGVQLLNDDAIRCLTEKRITAARWTLHERVRNPRALE